MTFIRCICLGQELKQIANSASKSADEDLGAEGTEQGGWEEVGKKNRSSLTRKTEVSRSVMHKLFWGEYRSTVRVKRHGVKPSITVEPFLILTLDLVRYVCRSVETRKYTLTSGILVCKSFRLRQMSVA